MKDYLEKAKALWGDVLEKWFTAPYWVRACVWVLVGFILGLAVN